MSLINDVLRDLDQRGAGASSAGAAPTVAQVRSVRRRLWPWWLLSAAVTGVLLHQAWREFDEEPVMFDLPASAGIESPPVTPARQQPALLMAQVSRPETLAPPAVITSSPDVSSPAVDSTEHAEQAEPAAATGPATEAPVAPSNPADIEDDDSRQVVEPVIRIERARAVSDPDTEPPLAARRALARGQDELARQQLESRLAQAPGDTEARLLLAQVHQQAGRAATAGRLLEAGLDQSDPAPIAASLARQLLERDQSERARDLLLAHAHCKETDADYQLLLGAALRQNGQHEQALALYQSLAELHPRRGQAWIGLGSTLETLNQPQAARSAYQRALQADDPRAIAFARSRLFALPPDTESAR